MKNLKDKAYHSISEQVGRRVLEIASYKILDCMPTEIRSLSWIKHDDFRAMNNVKNYLRIQMRHVLNEKWP